MADNVEWLHSPQDPLAQSASSHDGSGGDEINERLVRLEAVVAEIRGEIKGVKHAQATTIVAVGFVLAAVIAFGAYSLQRLDQLPAELRGIADSITGAITATRNVAETPPIIINVPPLAPDTSGASPSRPE